MKKVVSLCAHEGRLAESLICELQNEVGRYLPQQSFVKYYKTDSEETYCAESILNYWFSKLTKLYEFYKVKNVVLKLSSKAG